MVRRRRLVGIKGRMCAAAFLQYRVVHIDHSVNVQRQEATAVVVDSML